MNRLHHSHNVFHNVRRRNAVFSEPEAAAADNILAALVPRSPTLVARSPPSSTSDSSSSSTTTCSSDKDSHCAKESNSSSTLPIVLGVVIPILVLIAILFFFHRRLTKRQRLEDLNDKHGSLDFGLGEVQRKRKGKDVKSPEMTITDEKSLRRGRGLSMDIGGSPYLMPANLHKSRESVHSMSRSLMDSHDPYRPVAMLKDTDGYSSYPNSLRLKTDNGSVMTGSSGGNAESPKELLPNAQRMSRSYAPRSAPISPNSQTVSPPPPAVTKETPKYIAYTPPQSPAKPPEEFQRQSGPEPKPSSKLNSISSNSQPSSAKDSGYSSTTTSMSEQKYHTMQQSHLSNSSSVQQDFDDYGGAFTVTPPSPPRQNNAPTQEDIRRSRHSLDGQGDLAGEPAAALGMYWDEKANKRISMGVRPLPPEDMLEDHDPEQRANRIRSFYKEYFDDSKPGPAAQPQRGGYYEDVADEYLDGAIFDPASGQFVVAGGARPFAQPMGRRAMTPPPRGPPPRSRGPSTRTSANSEGRFGPRGHPAPKKRAPPPAPLTTLPTPHMLREDSALFSAADFAPPVSYRDRQLGRPESPLGVARPYSPSVRAHLPLASSFDDLSVMPSPHMLRKSGTFTALDFAPPPRFRDNDTMSDAGSIRSNRSGISARTNHAIRTGAYRVSRIPKEMVTTKDDLVAQLKPTWDQRGVSPLETTL
ncbi:MAG: hypothetical protein M1820_004299 [Bogoriella megaspora]|nr:MAG: hypothetical protein M1820_004299 [Bogoriella megaspora]